MRGTICRNPPATPARPCRRIYLSAKNPEVRTYTVHQGQQTHVRKKVDAAGKFCDKIAGALVGEFFNMVSEAVIPDDTVTIKNECFQI